MAGRHLLNGLNQYGAEFPLYVKALIEKLVADVSIERSRADLSVDSLYTFDEYFVSHAQDINEAFIHRHLMGLIAYVGEVFIRTEGGRWKTVLYEDESTWEPLIEDVNGKLYDEFFILIYKTLLEDEYSSLASCYRFK